MPEKESVYNLRNRSVKRKLWPVDHEQIKVDLSREKQKVQKEMTVKYNFDFTTGKPLRGKYTWAAVGCESPISSPCLLENESHCSSVTTTRALNSSSTDSNKQKSRKRTKENKNTATSKRVRAVKPVNKSNNSPLKSTYVLRADKRHSSKFFFCYYFIHFLFSTHSQCQTGH